MQRAHAANRECPFDINGKVVKKLALEHRHATHGDTAGRAIAIYLDKMPVIVPPLRLRSGNAATIRGVSVVKQQHVVVREKQVEVIAVTVRFPAEHCVVSTAAVLLHHEEQAHRRAVEQGRTVGRITENVVLSIEYDRRLAVDPLAVKRRLLAGLRLACVMPERRAVSPGADFTGLLCHGAAIQPET